MSTRRRSSRIARSSDAQSPPDSVTLPLPITTNAHRSVAPTQPLEAPDSPQHSLGSQLTQPAVHSDSFELRIAEDQRQLHHNSGGAEGPVESMGDGNVPSFVPRSGWSYSEGDEINIPETGLPPDAMHSQVVAQHSQSQQAQHRRPGVQQRYPIYHNPQESQIASVVQPIPPIETLEINSSPMEIQNATTQPAQQAAPQQASVPTPHQGGVPWMSAANRVLTPEERLRSEEKRQAALARRAARENERRKVARTLNFGGPSHPGMGTVQQQYPPQQQQQQHQYGPAAPLAVHPAPQWQPQAPPQAYPPQQPYASGSVSPVSSSQLQRAEQNRIMALEKRKNKLRSEAIALCKNEINTPPAPRGTPSPYVMLRNRIAEDVRKLMRAYRNHPHSLGTSGGSAGASGSPSPPSVQISTPRRGSEGTQEQNQGSLTPDQRKQIELDKKIALQRRDMAVEDDVARFLNDAHLAAVYEISVERKAAEAEKKRKKEEEDQKRWQEAAPYIDE